jgi:uncharacterized 2Fe-2S/4Fe-4S cluster protein (DUF4445 family)
MTHRVTVLPANKELIAQPGDGLLALLRASGLTPEAPCGGNGKCGKCRVIVDGQEQLACQTIVDRDLVVTLPQAETGIVLSDGIAVALSADGAAHLAIDIGTTTVVAYLIENGKILAVESRKNPQAAYGADVVSRISYGRKDNESRLTAVIRHCIGEMTELLLQKTGIAELDTICIAGNPAMQQLFLGLSVENLAQIPFAPLLTKAEAVEGGDYIPAWQGAKLLIVPDIAGYIGADTIACILATGMDKTEKLTLLVDIGTNGEMVLGNKHGLIACATAAGPALEGAQIRFGMQAATGAIDRVESGFICHCIGGGTATGICGSGLLDAVAVALEQGLINQRGRILNEDHILPLTDSIYLTQEDIRQLQQAKGAIAAGIRLMAQHLGVTLADIEQVYLAGAFGSFLNPHSACRIGLIPWQLEGKIQSVGNAAGSGAMLIACNADAFSRTETIAARVKHLDLATLPEWAKSFAQSMRFESETEFWCQKAIALGFSQAVAMDTAKLIARQDVRDMCAADKCRAYGKNWTCPPHCGTLDACENRMRRFSRGILLQTVGITQKTIDTKAYRETEQRHLQQFYALAEAIRNIHPDALALGSGGCRICQSCAYPEPCRFPEKACASMEAYGLFVTEVCRDHELAYHHGEKTVTYTACILF